MSDGKFHLPARKKEYKETSEPIRVSAEAYNIVIDMYNDSQLSMTQIVSKAILYAAENAVYDKEETNE